MKTSKLTKISSRDQIKAEPSLFAWLASATTVFLIVAVQFLPRGDHQTLRIGGVMILLAAAVFIFLPIYQLTKNGNLQVGTANMQAKTVVRQGLYASIRHPQYFGYMLLACGFMLLSQHWVAVLLTVFSVAFFYKQAVLEERYCLVQFGEPYARYTQRVPRFNLIQGVWRVLRDRKYMGNSSKHE